MSTANTKLRHSPPYLGCIADDFTGASDLASFLVASGMKTIQLNGVPDNSQECSGFDAIVIALKSRSEPADNAVKDSLKCLRWLKNTGCQKFYFKYCSTFDSTPSGNIGPVADAFMDELNTQSTIVCPALPVNGRTVYQGYLFVNHQLLHESPLKNHPLTPMRDSNIMRLIEAQGRGKAVNIPFSTVDQGQKVLAAELKRLAREYNYLVIDAISTKQLAIIGGACTEFPLITGGSGLAYDLGAEFIPLGFNKKNPQDFVQPINAPTIILSGSCSAMTQEQVAEYKKHHPALHLDPFKLMAKEQTVETIMQWLSLQIPAETPMIYSTADPEFVAKAQREFGQIETQTLVEKTLSKIVQQCSTLGIRNFIVAGGETSGAVVKALEIKSFQIGKSIAPGVPMLQTLDAGESKQINLALKSGNFGQTNFFHDAVRALKC